MVHEVDGPRTLIGQWLLAFVRHQWKLKALLREEILRTGGFTQDRVEVAFNAFRLTVRRRLLGVTNSAAITKFAVDMCDLFDTNEFLPIEAEALVREALGEAVPLGDIGPKARFIICQLFYARIIFDDSWPEEEVLKLLAEAEQMTVRSGWRPILPAEEEMAGARNEDLA